MKYNGLIKQSRTLDYAALVVVLGAIEVGLPGLQMDPVLSGWINMGIGVGIAILRYMTTTAVGEK